MSIAKCCFLSAVIFCFCVNGHDAASAVAPEMSDSIAGSKVLSIDSASVSNVSPQIEQRQAETESMQDCGESGCSPFNLNYLTFARSFFVPGQSQVLVVSAINTSDVAITDAVIELNIEGGTVLKSPGCEVFPSSRVECREGIVQASASVARTILVTPSIAQGKIHVAARSYSSQRPASPQAFKIWSYVTNSALRMRLTSIDASACPLVDATVNMTDVFGNSYTGPASFEFTEDDRPIIASGVPTTDIQRSIAVLLDNSRAVATSDWQAMREAVSAMTHDWQEWAEANNTATPAFAIYTMAPVLRRQVFSSSPAAIDVALASITQEAHATYIYDALAAAATDLTTRSGQRIALVLSGGTDAQGAIRRDEVVRLLRRENINVHGVPLDSAVEPILFDLAEATTGISKHAGYRSHLAEALSGISGDLRGTRRFQWTTLFAQPNYRMVDVYSSQPEISEYVYRDYTPSNTGCAETCIATRSAPTRVTKRHDVNVVLNVAERTGSPALSISETIPSGWIVTKVDSGGIWSPQTNKIFWHVEPGETPLALSYTMRNESSYATSLRFAGTSQSNDEPSRICGSTFAEVLPISPGGFAQQFGATQQAEAMAEAYAMAWKDGSPWPDSGMQIPVSHLTRVLQIQKHGGEYDTIDAPLPWIVLGTVAPVGKRSSARTLPIHYEAGTPIDVRIDFDPGTSSSASAIEEVPPAGWAVSGISAGGRFDPSGRMIRWGPFKDDSPRSLGYTLTPSVDSYESAVFTGRLSVDGINTGIEGSATLSSARIFANGFD